jgi:hypothetical protein
VHCPSSSGCQHMGCFLMSTFSRCFQKNFQKSSDVPSSGLDIFKFCLSTFDIFLCTFSVVFSWAFHLTFIYCTFSKNMSTHLTFLCLFKFCFRERLSIDIYVAQFGVHTTALYTQILTRSVTKFSCTEDQSFKFICD